MSAPLLSRSGKYALTLTSDRSGLKEILKARTGVTTLLELDTPSFRIKHEGERTVTPLHLKTCSHPHDERIAVSPQAITLYLTRDGIDSLFDLLEKAATDPKSVAPELVELFLTNAGGKRLSTDLLTLYLDSF